MQMVYVEGVNDSQIKRCIRWKTQMQMVYIEDVEDSESKKMQKMVHVEDGRCRCIQCPQKTEKIVNVKNVENGRRRWCRQKTREIVSVKAVDDDRRNVDDVRRQE